MEIEKHAFTREDLIAGPMALDLVNTVTARNGAPRDWLDGYGAVCDWARLSAAFEGAEVGALERLAEDDPAAAESALRKLRELREALHEVLSAGMRGEAPPAADLKRMERHWKEAAGKAVFAPLPSWTVEASGLDLVRHRAAWEAIDLLRSQDPARMRICDGPECGWLFLDSSKNNRRRWCDMKDCGNVAKARRHQARLKAGGG